MQNIILSRISLVWLLLVGATLVSWQLDQALGANSYPQAGIGILLIAFIKVRFVISEFMEVRNAPRALKLLCDGWCLFICAALIVLFMQGGGA